jgi:uroporphyrinogen decarboxylase
MNGRERILRALKREIPDRVPVFEWFVDATVGKAMVGSGDIMDIADGLDLDAINIRPDYAKQFLDAKVYTDEWGMKRKLTGDANPAILKSPIPDITHHLDFTFPDPLAGHRFSSIERAMERFGDSKALVLNLRDGFSDMRDLLGYEEALMALLLEPQAYAELLERAVDYNLALAKEARRRYGLQVVATTDDVANATGMLISPESYFELVAPMFKKAIQGYKSLGFLCIKHCDGNVDAVSDFWIECGIDCLDPIDPSGGYTMGGMKARYGSKICLKGNIDCTGALCDGTPEEVRQEVRQCIAQGAPGGGMILSSSNTIHWGVKPGNFRAMLDAARDYGTYPDLARGP